MKKIMLVLTLILALPMLLACEKKEPVYTMTLMGNGGTPISRTLEFTYMEDLGTLAYKPVRNNYTFGGYYTSKFCPLNEAQWKSTVVYDYEGVGEYYKWKEDLTVYACWVPR